MINQIWDTMMTISHLVFSRLHNEQSFEPGSISKKSLHKFPSFDVITSNSIDTNLRAFREYVLESCTEFNRAHFFMLFQAAILVYYPSIALSIVYQEYQQEIQDQAMQEMEEEEQMQSEEEDMSEYMAESKQSDVIQRYVAMKQSQLSQLAEMSRFDQQEISQQPLMRIIQLLQRVISQFMMQPPDKQFVDAYDDQLQLQSSQCLIQQPFDSRYYQYYQQCQQYQQQMVQQQQQQNIFQNVQSNYCQQKATKKAAQNNENEGVNDYKITVVIKLPGEGRQGRQGQVDGAGAEENMIVYQNYIITF